MWGIHIGGRERSWAMRRALPNAQQWLSRQPHGPLGLWGSWSGSLGIGSAAFLQARCGPNRPRVMNRPRSPQPLVGEHTLTVMSLGKMGSQAKASWHSWSYVGDPEQERFNSLLGLNLSKGRFQEDGTLTVWWENRDDGDGLEEQWANIKGRVALAEERREQNLQERDLSLQFFRENKRNIQRN